MTSAFDNFDENQILPKNEQSSQHSFIMLDQLLDENEHGLNAREQQVSALTKELIGLLKSSYDGSVDLAKA